MEVPGRRETAGAERIGFHRDMSSREGSPTSRGPELEARSSRAARSIWLLLAAALLLFLLFPARVLECDAVIYASAALQRELRHATYAGHLGFGPLALLAADLGGRLAPPLHPLFILPYVSMLAGLAGVYVFHALLRRWGTDPARALLFSAALFFTYAYWHFSLQAESHLPAAFFIIAFLATFADFLARRRARMALAAGALLGLATLMHQASILLILPALAGLLFSRGDRRPLSSGIPAFLGAYALVAVLPYLVVGFAVLELRSIADFRAWIMGLSSRGAWGHWRATALPAGGIGVLRSVVGSHHLLGNAEVARLAQRLFPTASWSDELALAGAVPAGLRPILAVLQTVLLGLIAVGLLRTGARLARLCSRNRPLGVFLISWVGVWVLFFIWWAPERAEFWIPLFPPLLWAAAMPQPGAGGERRGARGGSLALGLFVACLALVNFAGSILPQSLASLEPETLAAVSIEPAVRPGDVVVADLDPEGRATRFVSGYQKVDLVAAAGGERGATGDSAGAVVADLLAGNAGVFLVLTPLSANPERREIYRRLLERVTDRCALGERRPVRAPIEIRPLRACAPEPGRREGGE